MLIESFLALSIWQMYLLLDISFMLSLIFTLYIPIKRDLKIKGIEEEGVITFIVSFVIYFLMFPIILLPYLFCFKEFYKGYLEKAIEINKK